MTWFDLVRIIAFAHGITDLSETDMDWILWEYTAFPLADAAYIAGQLDNVFDVMSDLKGSNT